MADLIAIVTLGSEYSAIVLFINLEFRVAVPFDAAAIIFLILASIGVLLWHQKRLSQAAKQWVTLTVCSVVLGIAFFGADLLIALLNGHANPFRFPGGALGLPLTFLICPGGTIICLAGLVRASYIRSRVPQV